MDHLERMTATFYENFIQTSLDMGLDLRKNERLEALDFFQHLTIEIHNRIAEDEADDAYELACDE